MMKTAGKYVIIKRDRKENTTESGIIIGVEDIKRGTVISHPDPQYDGTTMLYIAAMKQVDGNDIVHLDSILCVMQEAA